MRPALTILPMSVETLWKPYKSDSRHLRETTSCFSDQQLGGDLSRADSQLALSHYSLFPSSPNDFTGAVVGNRHYSPGTIEVHPLYSGATYGTRCYSGCRHVHYRGKHRNYSGSRHYSAGCHYSLYPSAPRYSTGTIVGNRH